MKASTTEIDELVEVYVKPHHKIAHYLKKGWLQLDDFDLFLKVMKEKIYYNDRGGSFNQIVDVSFNHYTDGKVHFSVHGKFKGERICTYDAFAKRVWDYFNGSKIKKVERRETMNIGYIRVSSKEQNIQRQLKKMNDLHIEERFIFIDKESGKDFERPNYKAMKEIVREGDLVYIDSLDRLGRTYEGVITEWKYITRELNADIVVLENETLFDSRKFKSMGDMGKLMEDQFLSLLSYVSEQERKKIKQRQAEGIAAAKQRGQKLGRPTVELKTLTKEQNKILKENYDQWDNKEITGVQFAEMLELKKNSFYKIIKEYENTLSK